MKCLSLFAGVGGFDRGLELSGHVIVGQVEINAFANKILERRWPHITRWTDVREWTSNGDEHIDMLCGGFPCQDLSVAGKRGGLAGARSGLFSEILRIAKICKPTWGFFENVPGLFSSHAGRDMATVLEGLRECWPVVGYRVLDSRYFHLAQRRERVFFVCGPTERSVEEVLFESESSGRNLETSGEARAHVAASLRSRSANPGVSPPGRGGEDDMNIVTVSHALCAKKSGMRFDPNEETYVAACLNSAGNTGGFRIEPGEHLAVTHSLTAGGFDASEDGTGRGTPIIPIAEIGAKTQMGDGRNGCGIGQPGDPMFTLQAGKQHGVGVRRLTPTECERLQGFPEIEKSVIIELCLGHQNCCASADRRSHKSHELAGSAERIVPSDRARYVSYDSALKHQKDNRHALSDVHIFFGLEKVEIHNQEKLSLRASLVNPPNTSLLPIGIGDFAHLSAGLHSIVDQIIQNGEVGLRLSERCSMVLENGDAHVKLYGSEITQLVNDVRAGSIMANSHMKSTISGRFSIENIELDLITSYCSVVAAISGFIPAKTLHADSFRIDITTRRGWTCLCKDIPCTCPDGHRYQAMGNAVSVPVIEWIGKRLKQLERSL